MTDEIHIRYESKDTPSSLPLSEVRELVATPTDTDDLYIVDVAGEKDAISRGQVMSRQLLLDLLDGKGEGLTVVRVRPPSTDQVPSESIGPLVTNIDEVRSQLLSEVTTLLGIEAHLTGLINRLCEACRDSNVQVFFSYEKWGFFIDGNPEEVGSLAELEGFVERIEEEETDEAEL